MRLWSLHPKYLDAKGLTASWREGLLARKVLLGETRGYRNHPQLTRFRQMPDPVEFIDTYLSGICDEAARRGYSFDKTKLGPLPTGISVPVTLGQLRYEFAHLCRKLEIRDPVRLSTLSAISIPDAHPLFEVIDGEVEPWEKQ